MPIEIRQLTIRARVESSDKKEESTPDRGGSKLKDAEINMIVDKVMRILKDRTER